MKHKFEALTWPPPPSCQSNRASTRCDPSDLTDGGQRTCRQHLGARYCSTPSGVCRGPRFTGSGLLEKSKRDQGYNRWVLFFSFTYHQILVLGRKQFVFTCERFALLLLWHLTESCECSGLIFLPPPSTPLDSGMCDRRNSKMCV